MSIIKSKKIFNQFFKEDLYGKFDDDKNIILSRGCWNDEFLKLPTIFKFCIKYTLKNNWLGYSDSLGHKNTRESLVKMLNTRDIFPKYKIDNTAITIGNVATINYVFRQLKDLYPNANILTFRPYYPPILKSVSYYFNKIFFVNSLISDEDKILKEIKIKIKEKNIKILFLSNSIGVEGRIFSQDFWSNILKITRERKVFLVIDEGDWFYPLEYGKNINNKNIIRIVSLSKKYGVPGCKIGYMLGDIKFINNFYDCASTNYGGPLSCFFLLGEFIYEFEFIFYSKKNIDNSLENLSKKYNIKISVLKKLYLNFTSTLSVNTEKLKKNRDLIYEWRVKNKNYILNYYDFGGINIFIQFKKNIKSYRLFLKLLKEYKVSVMPSSCLGDMSDSMVRITLLEKTDDLHTGLLAIEKLLKSYAK